MNLEAEGFLKLFVPVSQMGLKRKKTPETDTDTNTELDKSLQEAQNLQLSALKNYNIEIFLQVSLLMADCALGV